MRNKWVVWSIPIIIVGLLGWNFSLAQEHKADQPKKEEVKKEEPKKEEPKEKDIVDTAKAADNLKTFVKLLDAAGLTADLKGKGPFTVFVPTDEAFNKLGKEKLDNLQKPENKAELAKILKNHIVKGKHLAAEVKTMKDAETMTGKVMIAEKDGAVMFGLAKITKTDVAASNGVIHYIDHVVVPADKPKDEPKKEPKKEEPKKPEPKKEEPKKPAGGGGGG